MLTRAFYVVPERKVGYTPISAPTCKSCYGPMKISYVGQIPDGKGSVVVFYNCTICCFAVVRYIVDGKEISEVGAT